MFEPTACKADGDAASTARLQPAPSAGSTAHNGAAPRTSRSSSTRCGAPGIAKHFAIPYNRKLWAVPLTEMETSWLGGRVPLPDLEEMIEGALSPVAQADGAQRPLRLPAARRLPGADGRLPAAPQGRASAATPEWSASRPRRHTRDAVRRQRDLPYEHLISTMPLPVLVRLMGDEAPAEVRAGGRRPAPRLGALRQPRGRPGEPDREALDLLSRRHRSSTASSCRATPARTATRRAASA